MAYEFTACPVLEFSVQFWLPHDKNNMIKWEKGSGKGNKGDQKAETSNDWVRVEALTLWVGYEKGIQDHK